MRKKIENGCDPKHATLNTDLQTLKSLVVKWLCSSWLKLKQSQQMIRSGWNTLQLTRILDPAFQVEALTKVTDNQVNLDPTHGVGVYQHQKSSSDRYNEDDDDYEADEDEEDGEIETALAACIEERIQIDTIQSMNTSQSKADSVRDNSRRKSSRLQNLSQNKLDLHLARLLQEEALDHGCYIIE